ncbi:MAG: arginine deiminase family protein, partial [Ferruginibacter sp.]
ADFEDILKKQGADIFYFPEDDAVNMDSVYCRDAAVATDAGMILCNMGKEARKQEPLAERKAFEANGFKILGSITAPGTLEGGDVAWLDEHTLAVGHGYRTNAEGIRQLTALLKPLNVEVITVPLPHYKGPSDVFHLMSILSPVDTKLAVIYSPLMPVVFRELLLQRGYGLVEVPDEEFDSMGCNVLAMAPGNCLMVDGNPITKAALEKAGCTVTVYKGAEISVKGGGGPTCLTRPVYRIS